MTNNSYFFGTFLTLFIYILVLKLKKGRKLFLYNSVLYSVIIIIALLSFLNIDYDTYSNSTTPISSTLSPLVVLFAIPLYKHTEILKKYYKSIFLGIIVSGMTSTLTVIILSKLLKLNDELMVSIIPKAITTPMALSVVDMLTGIKGITVVAVLITGTIGASVANMIISKLSIKNPIAKGVALGASSHGIGTSKAIELGDEIGAVSALSMALTGIIFILTTSLVLMFL